MCNAAYSTMCSVALSHQGNCTTWNAAQFHPNRENRAQSHSGSIAADQDGVEQGNMIPSQQFMGGQCSPWGQWVLQPNVISRAMGCGPTCGPSMFPMGAMGVPVGSGPHVALSGANLTSHPTALLSCKDPSLVHLTRSLYERMLSLPLFPSLKGEIHCLQTRRAQAVTRVIEVTTA